MMNATATNSTTLTVNESIDMAVERLPRLRRRIARRRLSNPNIREATIDELAAKLADCPHCAALGVAPTFAAENVGGESTLTLEASKLEDFLELVIKYLPTILDMVLKYLPLIIGSIVLAFVLGPTNASAQVIDAEIPVETGMVCTEDGCTAVALAPAIAAASDVTNRPVFDSVVRVASVPVQFAQRIRSRRPLRSVVAAPLRRVASVFRGLRSRITSRRCR